MTRDMKDSGIEWAKTIPNNWKVKRIKYLMKELKNKTSNGCEERALSVTQDKGIIPSIEANIANPSSSYENYMEVKKGDLIFNKYKAHSGVFFVTQYDGIVTFNYSIYRCFKGVNSKYCEYLFKTSGCISEFKQRLHGVGESISPLYTKDLFDIAVIMPPFEEQNRIVNFLDVKCGEIDALSEDIQSEIDILHAYKQSVITEAVTKGLDKNVSMKDSGLPWIGSVPKHWLVEKVKYHLYRYEPKNQGDKQVLSVYREYGVIPKDSRDDNHNVTSEDTSKYKYVKPNDLVINKMKAWQGSMGVSAYEGIVSPAYFIYHFRDKQIVPMYLHYLFRSCYKDEFRRISGGIREGQWDLSPEQFENTMLLIPPVEEQSRIVTEIDVKTSEIESILAQKQEQLELLADYKKNVIYEYVTGKKEVSDGEF